MRFFYQSMCLVHEIFVLIVKRLCQQKSTYLHIS